MSSNLRADAFASVFEPIEYCRQAIFFAVMLVQHIQLHSFKKQLAIDLFCLTSDKNLRRDYPYHYKNQLFAPISEWIPLNPNQRCPFISTRFDISEK
jgi:hypothetical protein